MSYDLHDGDVIANPGRVGAWPTNPAPATDRRKYTGRHRPGPYRDRSKRPFVFPPAAPEHNPLHPADRVRMAPKVWADPDRYLPAPEGERTGRMDTDVVLAQVTELPDTADRGQVLAEIRDAITTPAAVLTSLDQWVEDGCPIDDQTTPAGGTCPTCHATYPCRIPVGEDQRCWTCATADQTGIDDQTTDTTEGADR